jgi:hypothetical protein
MKQGNIVSNLSLPLLACVVVLSISALSRSTATLAPGSTGGSREQAFSSPPPVLQFPDSEWGSEVDLDWEEIDKTVARIRSNLLNSINDEFEESIDEEFQQLLVSPDLNPDTRSPDPLTR